MTNSRSFYSRRLGIVPSSGIDELRAGVSAVVNALDHQGFFQIDLGCDCVDGYILGTLGEDVAGVAFAITGVRFWPLSKYLADLEEHQIFTALEFLHDHSAEPVEWTHHDFNGCGIHTQTGNEEAGRQIFRERTAPVLAAFGSGYDMSAEGEIGARSPVGLDYEPTELGDEEVDERVRNSVRQFRRYGSDESTRRQAVTELAHVLEYLRDGVGTQLPRADEDRLFEIANNYAIRHHNQKQRSDYDDEIWLRWIFHTFLNAIDVSVQLIRRKGEYHITRCPACHQDELYDDSWADADSDGSIHGGNYRACANCGWNSMLSDLVP